MITTQKKVCSLLLVLCLLMTLFPQHVNATTLDNRQFYTATGNTFRFEPSVINKTYGDAPFTNAVINGRNDMDHCIVVYSSSNNGIASVDNTGQVTIHSAGLVDIAAHLFYVVDEEKGETKLLNVAHSIIYIKPDMIVEAYSGTYDGAAHAPEVNPMGGGTVYYSTDVPLNTDNYDQNGSMSVPQCTDAGITEVYYIVKPNNGFIKTSEETLRQMPEFFITGQTQICINKAAPVLTFASASVSKSADSAAFTNGLTKNTDGTVMFSSSNPSVAAVDSSTGQVTVKRTGTVTITASAAEGKNYIAGTASYTLTVSGAQEDPSEDSSNEPFGDLSAYTAVLSQDQFIYDGEPHTPAVTVKNRSVDLVANKDYTVSYSNNIHAGTATVIIKGKGKYTGNLTKTFTISKAAPVLKFASGSLIKTAGSSPFINKLTKETDGTITFFSDNISVASVDGSNGLVTIKGPGTATITASASAGGDYQAGTAHYTVQIIKEEKAGFDLASLTYNFSNSSQSFGYPSNYRIPLEVFQLIFGDTAKARFYYTYCKGWSGNCFGMSSTAGMFNMPDSGITVSGFRVGAGRVSELKITDRNTDIRLSLQRFIEAMQVAQFTDSAQQKMRDSKDDLNAVCEQVKRAKSGNGPVLVCIFGPGSGHAVIGYDIVDLDASKSRMYLYDCNYPNTERYIDLTRDSSGRYQKWHYYLNDMYHWGTDYDGCEITCVPYTDYLNVWRNRKGNLSIYANTYKEAASGTMAINAENAVLYDENMTQIGRLENGQLRTARTDIHQLYMLGITAGQTGTGGEKNILLSLPAGGYTVKNEDTGRNFEVAMADTDLSVQVSTESELVNVEVNDVTGEVSASIDAKSGESYQIELHSTMPEKSGSLKVDGIGKGETVGMSQVNGTVYMVNMDDTQVKKEGIECEQEQGTGTVDITDQEADGKEDVQGQTGSGDINGQNIGRRMSKGDIFTYNAVRYKVNQADASGTKVNLTCMGISGRIQKNLSIPQQFMMDGVTCTVTKIGVGAFAGSSLTGISLPNSITSIGSRAFKNCKQLKKITIPAKTESIGKKVFYECRNLKKIVIKTKKLTNGKIGNRTFYGISSKAVIIVPKDRFKTYQKLLKTCGFAGKVKN